MKSLENILAFHQIEKYLTEEEKKSVSATMGIPLDEMNRRLIGKKKEDEFILILLFLNNCKTLSGFDEGVSKLGDRTYTPDLIIELKNGKKFLLEIKSTGKSQYSISGGNLQKRMNYASSLNLDLYFAISICNFWMLFPAVYLQSRHGKIGLEDWQHSCLDDMLGTFGYLFPPKLEIRSVYSKERDDGIGIGHDEYGNLISYEFRYDGRKIFRVKGKNSPYKGYSMLLEALQDRLSTEKQDIVHSGDFTVITEKDDGENKDPKKSGTVGGYNYISEYQFLLAPVLHTTHTENGSQVKYDVDDVVNAMKEDEAIPRFEKWQIRGLMQKFVDWGIPVRYLHNDKIYNLPSTEEFLRRNREENSNSTSV